VGFLLPEVRQAGLYGLQREASEGEVAVIECVEQQVVFTALRNNLAPVSYPCAPEPSDSLELQVVTMQGEETAVLLNVVTASCLRWIRVGTPSSWHERRLSRWAPSGRNGNGESFIKKCGG